MDKYLDHVLAIEKMVTDKENEPTMFAEGCMNIAMVRSSQDKHDTAEDLLTEAMEQASLPFSFLKEAGRH